MFHVALNSALFRHGFAAREKNIDLRSLRDKETLAPHDTTPQAEPMLAWLKADSAVGSNYASISRDCSVVHHACWQSL